MKKWIGIGSTFLIIILLSAYYFMGIATERALKKSIALLNQSQDISIQVKDYNRGWFRSKANLMWVIKIPQAPQTGYGPHSLSTEKIYHIDIPLNVSHGPIQFANYKPWLGLGYAESKVTLPPVYEQRFRSIPGQENSPLVHVVIFVNFLAQTNLQVDLPSFKLIAKEGNTQFKWRGLKANLNVSSHREHLQGELSLKGFSWLEEGLKGIHGPVNGDFNVRMNPDHLYLGTAHLNFSSIALIKNNEKLIRLIGMDFSTRSEATNGLYNAFLSASVKQALLQNRNYGLGELEVEVLNMDAKALAVINQKLSQSASTEIDRQRIFWSILPDVPMLLSKGAQFKVTHLELNLPEGKVNANLTVNWPQEHVINPLQFLQKMTGEGTLRVSSTVLSHWVHDYVKQKLVMPTLPNTNSPALSPIVDPEILIAKKTTDKIQELIQLGVLTVDGSDYVLIFKFLNGRLFINDRPFASSMIAI